jgi:hypothetical protein
MARGRRVGGALLAGHGAPAGGALLGRGWPGGRARRRSVALPLGAGASKVAPVWAGAYVEVGPSGRLVSRRGWSTDSVRFPRERMELIEAVQNQDLETVEVRRPLEAGSSTDRTCGLEGCYVLAES